MANVHLALGSNLGDKEFFMRRSVELIEERVGSVLKRSGVMESEPWGYSSANGYLNEVVVVECGNIAPLDLLDITQSIESELGRVTRTSRKESYSDRTIDIDLLYYHNNNNECVVFNSERLILPHPEIEGREFLMTLLSRL